MLNFFCTLIIFNAAPAWALPVIQISDFAPGRSWTWDYARLLPNGSTGPLYSRETYTVIEVDGSEVLLEMSTIFYNQSWQGRQFRSHHRIRADVNRCQQSFRNPAQRGSWSIRMYAKNQGGIWHQIKTGTTLAFEEKFNCNPHHHDSREFLTVTRDTERGPEFTHLRWRRIEGSWFTSTGPDAAVMSEKNFNHGAGSQNYLVRRR